MAYKTDPNNQEANKNLEKMGKEADAAGLGLVWWAIIISGVLIAYMFLNPI